MTDIQSYPPPVQLTAVTSGLLLASLCEMKLRSQSLSLSIYLEICHDLGRLKHLFTRLIQCLNLMVSKCFQLQDGSLLLRHSSPQPYSEPYHALELLHLCIFRCSNSRLLASTAHQADFLICSIIPTKCPPSPHGNFLIPNPFLLFQSTDPF